MTRRHGEISAAPPRRLVPASYDWFSSYRNLRRVRRADVHAARSGVDCRAADGDSCGGGCRASI
ncbi:MAG: hypothetical protein M3Q33_09450 [Acidobacteriota bacterium]|nr:hypothetical protein [Acidobacteriota bacterium]